MSAGKPLRLVQVSDTHLSATHAWFVDNFQIFATLMAKRPPDLIVHTGDVAFNGPDAPDDLTFGHAALTRLPAPWRAIPGNHDVGETPRDVATKQPVTAARLAAWDALFGRGFWRMRFGDWRLVGVNTALLGSGLAAEREQDAFFSEALAPGALGPAMVFAHIPPFLDNAEETRPTRRALPLPQRRKFLDRCKAGGVRIIACGHLHIYRAMRHEGIDIVWGPATSCVNIPARVNPRTIIARAGYLEWTFDGESVSHRLVEPPDMPTLDLHRWIEEHGSVTKLPPKIVNG